MFVLELLDRCRAWAPSSCLRSTARRDAWSASCRPGTALEAADRAAKRWEMVLLDHEQFPEIHTAYVQVGRGDGDFDREPRYIS